MTFEQRYVQARRRFIEADFANLNDMQRKAVLATEGPLLLLAGAGSGKTTVLIHRIANLIQYGRGSDTDEVPDTATEADLALLERTDLTPDERRRAQRAAALEPVEPWRIIAITFTNKAADELKDRIERMLGPEAAADIWASTFHSACVRILRRDADKLGYPNSFTIYDTSDSQAVVKRILTEISRAKDSGITPEQYLARAQATHNPRSIRIGEVYQTYWQRLFSAGAMDFDDLIYNTVRLLDEHEDVREHWQRRFRYVLIDEYQDTNNLQYQLAALLADGWGNICVVGDDDQSIYKFRGATIENILNFEKQYKNARTIRLEQNYRSTGRILDAANHVIANNTGRKGKTLWTKAEAGDPLTLYCATNENDEARYVATKIMDDFGHGMNFRDHAVLYRMNGSPSVSGKTPFTDVRTDEWYSAAVLWAYQNGIVTGMSDTTFAPINNVTREQMATILFRYTKTAAPDKAKASADLSGFADAGSVNDWAVDAMRWAVGQKLIAGITLEQSVYLQPRGNATRAQAATVLTRYYAQ